MKAHIARNQNAGVPLILGWNLSPPTAASWKAWLLPLA